MFPKMFVYSQDGYGFFKCLTETFGTLPKFPWSRNKSTHEKRTFTTILNWIWSGFAQLSHTGTLADVSMELGRIKMGSVRVLSFHEIIICL